LEVIHTLNKVRIVWFELALWTATTTTKHNFFITTNLCWNI